MSPLNILFIIGVILALGLLIVVFVIPTEVERKKKQKREKANQPDVGREQALEKQIRHLENTMPALRKQIETAQHKERDLQKELLIERAKVEKLQEKLNQERDWQEKGAEKVDKKMQEISALKNEFSKLQEAFNKEHARNLHLENETRDLTDKNSQLNSQRRSLEMSAEQFKSKLEASEREVARLNNEITFLSRQKEDTTWIAKSEYLQLEKKLKEVEKDLARVKRDTSKDQSNNA